MKQAHFFNSLILLCLTALAMPAAAEVLVTFTNIDHYTDLGHYQNDKDANQKALEKHFLKMGEKLAAGQSLKIEVLDVDMAGRFEPEHFQYQDVRFLRSITWPAMKLHYVLTTGGKVTAEGEESIADMDYQHHISGYFSDDNYRYEKYMLDRWFENRIVARVVASK